MNLTILGRGLHNIVYSQPTHQQKAQFDTIPIVLHIPTSLASTPISLMSTFNTHTSTKPPIQEKTSPVSANTRSKCVVKTSEYRLRVTTRVFLSRILH